MDILLENIGRRAAHCSAPRVLGLHFDDARRIKGGEKKESRVTSRGRIMRGRRKTRGACISSNIVFTSSFYCSSIEILSSLSLIKFVLTFSHPSISTSTSISASRKISFPIGVSIRLAPSTSFSTLSVSSKGPSASLPGVGHLHHVSGVVGVAGVVGAAVLGAVVGVEVLGDGASVIGPGVEGKHFSGKAAQYHVPGPRPHWPAVLLHRMVSSSPATWRSGTDAVRLLSGQHDLSRLVVMHTTAMV